MKDPKPPEGYRRARPGKKRKKGYLYFDGNGWEPGTKCKPGQVIKVGESPVANPVQKKKTKVDVSGIVS